MRNWIFPKWKVHWWRGVDLTVPCKQCTHCTLLYTAPFPIKDLELVERRVQQTERRRKTSQMKMLSTTKAMLKAFHRNLNEKLADLLGDDQFTWPELATSDIEAGATDYQQVLLPWLVAFYSRKVDKWTPLCVIGSFCRILPVCLSV